MPSTTACCWLYEFWGRANAAPLLALKFMPLVKLTWKPLGTVVAPVQLPPLSKPAFAPTWLTLSVKVYVPLLLKFHDPLVQTGPVIVPGTRSPPLHSEYWSMNMPKAAKDV